MLELSAKALRTPSIDFQKFSYDSSCSDRYTKVLKFENFLMGDSKGKETDLSREPVQQLVEAKQSTILVITRTSIQSSTRSR